MNTKLVILIKYDQDDSHHQYCRSLSIFIGIHLGFLPSPLYERFVLIGDIEMALRSLDKVFNCFVGKWVLIAVVGVICHRTLLSGEIQGLQHQGT